MADTTETRPIYDQLLDDGRLVREKNEPKLIEEQTLHAQEMLRHFIEDIVEAPGGLGDADLAAAISARIAQLDDQISDQLNEVLHHPKFQAIESAWRGLAYLVFNTETNSMLKIRLLVATKGELLKDLEKAVDFDQSALFKKVYEEEYGTFGGAPYSVLIGGYEFDRGNSDLSLLEMLSNVAAAAHAPFLASPAPGLFDMDGFQELGLPRDLAKIFETADMAKWRSFRGSEDSRYVALLLPRVLMRLPYGQATRPIEEFDYEEKVDGLDHSKYLWGNPAFVMGQKIGQAFSLYGWTAAIRGVEGGGKVSGLPVHTFVTPDRDLEMKCPTEVSITDRREKELSDLGFISLVHCKGEDYAAFFGGQTVNRPKVYNTPQANANSRLSAMLPYMLNASRFAHYIKVIMRDKVGSFMTKDNVSSYLNTWVMDYVLAQDDAGQSIKAQYPLREARVDVTDIPGKPGCYNAVVFLRPHFQLEELTASIRLVAELPPPAA